MSDRKPAVLIGGARTPVGRYQGALIAHRAVELGGIAVAAARERFPGIEPELAVLGNVLQGGSGQNPARQAAIRGGVSRTVPAITLNDVCLASMSAVAYAAANVTAGRVDAVLVGGFESMSDAPHIARIRGARRPGNVVLVDMMITDGLHCAVDDVGMGPLSDAENDRLGITREQQDAFALTSHLRAAAAAARGFPHVVELGGLRHDEGVRPDVTAEQLAALRPAFTPGGTITAGNASQLSDAAAAGFVGTHAAARAAGHDPLAEIVDWHVVAGPDTSLHLKPAMAARPLLERHGLRASDIGLWEINEAFAGVVLATMAELELDHERVNVNGGAVAVGHPLGASGFRLVLDLAHEMRRRGVQLGVAAICGGGGQGEAMLLRSCDV
jgi:acetyl-CoA C-acetyltransferase